MNNVTDTNTHCFKISYKFYDKTHETEIALLIDGNNILAFSQNGKTFTTRWNLDELAFWLRNFLNNMAEDPYPVKAEGNYASIKDINARTFDSDDDEEFDAYYDKLDCWNLRHRWHTASEGGILADLYFQLNGNNVEISWNNQNPDKNVHFKYELGGVGVAKEQFCSEVDSFLKAYANHWF